MPADPEGFEGGGHAVSLRVPPSSLSRLFRKMCYSMRFPHCLHGLGWNCEKLRLLHPQPQDRESGLCRLHEER